MLDSKLSKLKTNIKDFTSNISQVNDGITEKVLEVIKSAGIDKVILKELLGGGVLVKKKFIHKKIIEALDDFPEVKLIDLNIQPEGLNIELELKKSIISFKLNITVFIEKIILSKEKQLLMCKVKIKKSSGNVKLFDFIIAPIVEAIIQSLLKKKIDNLKDLSLISFENEINNIEVNLDSIKAIKPLLISVPLPIPFLAKIILVTPIELLKFDNIIHKSDGLVIKANINTDIFNK